jgi:hypothetical protein
VWFIPAYCGGPGVDSSISPHGYRISSEWTNS